MHETSSNATDSLAGIVRSYQTEIDTAIANSIPLSKIAARILEIAPGVTTSIDSVTRTIRRMRTRRSAELTDAERSQLEAVGLLPRPSLALAPSGEGGTAGPLPVAVSAPAPIRARTVDTSTPAAPASPSPHVAAAPEQPVSPPASPAPHRRRESLLE
jgi:hypothetical protein